jgi:hypothetical protein
MVSQKQSSECPNLDSIPIKDAVRGHGANIGTNACASRRWCVFFGLHRRSGRADNQRWIVQQSIAFGGGSVAGSEGRATRRTDEKGCGGSKEWKFYCDNLAPQQAVRTISLEKAFVW